MFASRHAVALGGVLLVALAVRLLLWNALPRVGLIGDEAEYLAAADWLAQGRGFAWHQQWLWTRAPLYPLLLAAHIRVFGLALQPIFVTQIALSMLNVALVYVLAVQVGNREQGTADREQSTEDKGQPFPEPVEGVGADSSDKPSLSPVAVPTVAGLCAALYLPFAAYAQIVLSETLYLTLLLGAFVALAAWAQRRRGVFLVAAAGLLGLASLTRGLTLGFLPLVALWVWQAKNQEPRTKNQEPRTEDARAKEQTNSGRSTQHAARSTQHAVFNPLRTALLFIVVCTTVILPWSLYASQTYGGPVVVDTTGGFNLLLGARTAYDGSRSDAPTRNFVLALLDPRLPQDERRQLLAGRGERTGACLYRQNDPRLLAALEQPPTAITQAERQQLMTAEALCLLRETPGAFVAKSLAEFVDFFQINYTGAERMTSGFALGRLPHWYTVALFLLDDTLYVVALPLAVVGWAMLRVRGQATGNREQGIRRLDRKIRTKPSTRNAALTTLIGLWLVYNLATAPLLFAINRFRVPLMPFVFILAAYALVRLLRGDKGWLRSSYGLLCSGLALVLTLVTTTPYAYLEPRAPDAPSRWASYLGPYPSSVASTTTAWTTRPAYRNSAALAAALGAGDANAAQTLLATTTIPPYTRAIAEPLLLGLEGDPITGLEYLDRQPIEPLARWQTNVVRGELLRQVGDWDAARAALSPTLVDDQNPLAWAWAWLHPPPLSDERVDLADDLDVGYIDGFYLGEYDPTLGATIRWSGPEARVRFPQAGNGVAQTVCFNLAGSGWPTDLALPTVRVYAADAQIGSIALTRDLRESCLPLPPQPPGTDVELTLRTPTFVPGALDLLGQQGPQVGQLRLLGAQVDWAELRR